MARAAVPSPLSPLLSPLRPAFTLIELLVTITIIGILAGMMLGALQMARTSAREAATKATIAKLNTIIMRRYESYMTRRVPISTSGQAPSAAAKMRVDCIRDLMRLEMPDFFTDIYDLAKNTGNTNPVTTKTYFYWNSASDNNMPALWKLYNTIYDRKTHAPGTDPAENAKCLYLVVSVGSPEAMEQFSENEIAADANDGLSYFIDGWGKPIYWLRWAPGFSSGATPPAPSDLQTMDATNDHDPFDPRNVYTSAYRLVPLIYSTRGNNQVGISWGTTGTDWTYNGDPYHQYNDPQQGPMYLGSIVTKGSAANAGFGIISNHHIEQR
jgi:prepilin-type N-terminal cleavage/methylation domain-containing protein